MSDQSRTDKICGICTVCCLALAIKESGKPAGVMCQHCTGTGCGIYENRYEVCRGFLCGWRMISQLDDSWRPDRSGILLRVVEAKDVPEEHRSSGNGIQIVILGGEKAILRAGFADYVGTLVSRNVAVYLSADSPKTLINKYLRDLVAARDKPSIIKMLVHIYRQHVELRGMNDKKPLPWVEVQ